MNKTRRERIQSAILLLDEVRNEIDTIKDEEQEAYENLTDNLNNSERANNMYENIDILEEAMSEIEETINNLEEIFER